MAGGVPPVGIDVRRAEQLPWPGHAVRIAERGLIRRGDGVPVRIGRAHQIIAAVVAEQALAANWVNNLCDSIAAVISSAARQRGI